MAFSKLLLIYALFFTATTAFYYDTSEIAPCVRWCLPYYIRPMNYRIQLNLFLQTNFETAYFQTMTSIDIFISKETKNISLHSVNLKINQVQLYKSDMRGVYEPSNTEYSFEETNGKPADIITFYFNATISPGEYTLHINYLVDIYNNTGFFITSYINEKAEKRWLVATHFQQQGGARKVFPCWDRPDFMAKFEITVLHHQNYTVRSNMPIKTITPGKGNVIQTVFEKTPDMPIYQIAIVLGFNDSLVQFSILDEYTNIWYRKHIAQYANYTLDVMKSIKHNFGHWEWIKFIVPKVDYFAIPNYQDTSKENVGLVLHREEDIIYNEELNPIAHKIELTRIIARKIIHAWFGNILFDWIYLWFKIGFVTFFEAYVVEKAIPNSRMMDLFVVQIQQDTLRLDSDEYVTRSLTESSSQKQVSRLHVRFPFFSLLRVPVIFRMLYYIVLDDVFWNGIHKYLQKIREEKAGLDRVSADPREIWIAMQTSLMEDKFYKNKFSVSNMMEIWTRKSGYPVLSVTRSAGQYISKIILTVNKNMGDLPNTDGWFLPITYTTSEFIFTEEYIYNNLIWLTSKNLLLEFDINESDCVIVNLQQIGYYRVNYDTENWQKIARYLNSENYTKIHVLNRAQIIDDAFHLMVAQELNSSIFWELTTYLSRETDYVAWYPMFKALEYMSRVFSYQIETIKEHMTKIIGNVLHTITYKDRSEESDLTKCLRQEAIRWACTFGDVTCKNSTFNNSQQHLTVPIEKNNLLLGAFELISCNSFNGATPNYFLGMYKENFRFDNYINLYILIGRHSHVFLLKVAKHAKEVIKFFSNNFEAIKSRPIAISATLAVLINLANSTDQLHKIHDFVINNLKSGTCYTYNKTTIFMEQCEKSVDEITKCTSNLTITEQQISYVLHKINTRVSQIKKKMDFLKILGDPTVIRKDKEKK